VCNELLVTFTPGTTLRAITATANIVGGTVVGWLPSLGIYQIGLPTCGAARLEAAVAKLQAQPDVVSAQTNTIGQLFTSVTPNDPLFPDQWSLPKIQAPSAWSMIETGRTIGIIDTGISYNHPDLADQVILGLDQCASLDANKNCVVGFHPMDTFGHGTGTASIAGATTNNGIGMAGVAFRVWLIAEKIGIVQGNQFVFTSYGVAYAIVDAVDRGARVINLSLGTGGPENPRFKQPFRMQ
jgi:thermitase